MRADIQAARPQADFLIVFQHWGVEYETVETSHQQALARAAIDAGADLVVGAHPHVIQPHEIYKSKPIIYSLGHYYMEITHDGKALPQPVWEMLLPHKQTTRLPSITIPPA